MRRNAIARIIIYSVLALVLTGILVVAIAPEFLMYHLGDHTATDVPTEGHAPGTIRQLEIDWASGRVTIQKGTGNDIWFYESAPDGCWYKMDYECDENTLSISYSKNTVSFGFGNNSIPRKDLVIQVPQDWYCEELEIDGAALQISVQGLEIETIDLDGAAMEFNIDGRFQNLSCDGAECNLYLISAYCPKLIEIDGAACSVDMILPADGGFHVKANGWGCGISSDLPYTSGDGEYFYGERQCVFEVNGMGCFIRILSDAHNPPPSDSVNP